MTREELNAIYQQLSPRQKEVLCLFWDELSDPQISQQLNIIESTVRRHLSDIHWRFFAEREGDGRNNQTRLQLLRLREQVDRDQPPTTIAIAPNPTPNSHTIIVARGYNDDTVIAHLRTEIAQGIDINERNNDGCTPLSLAVKMNRRPVVEFLLEQPYIEVNSTDLFGCTPLHKASSIGSIILVQKLIDAGADPKALTNMRATTVYEAAFGSNNPEIIRLLEARGVDINLSSEDGFTPLMVAIWRENYAVAECLIDRTTDIDVIDVADLQGETALYKAFKARNYNLLLKLMDKYVKAGRAPRPYQLQPRSQPRTLFIAAENGDTDGVRQFLRQDSIQVNQRYEPYQRTALHQAAENGHFEIVRLLVEHGADVFARNNHGRTPRELALQSQHEIVNFLRDQEAN